MQSEINFIGLFEYRENEFYRSIKLTNFEDEFITKNQSTIEDYNKQKQPNQPYLRKIPLSKNKHYLLILRNDITQEINNASKGMEDHLLEHLSPELQTQEWKQRAIKIFTTWNLSEKKELEEFIKSSEDVEKQFKNFGMISLGLTVITLILLIGIQNII